MVKIGITGGIGSGKSLICRIFSMMGTPVYYADERAKYLMNYHIEVKQALIHKFGTAIYERGTLNRPLLAQIIFNDKNALDYVNSIVHPAVGNDFIEWTQNLPEGNYCLHEAALLFESGLYTGFDCIITVVCPEEIRIQRVMNRDNTNYEKVYERVRNQWSDEEKMKRSDYIIYNNNKMSIIEQILQIHDNILKYK
jgi:dephospho-CoA kinase